MKREERIAIFLGPNAMNTNTLEEGLLLAEALSCEVHIVHVRTLESFPVDPDSQSWERTTEEDDLMAWINSRVMNNDVKPKVVLIAGGLTETVPNFIKAERITSVFIGQGKSRESHMSKSLRIVGSITKVRNSSLRTITLVQQEK